MASGRYDFVLDLRAILDGIARGDYKPRTAQVFKCKDAPRAHDYLSSQEVIGKLVLEL